MALNREHKGNLFTARNKKAEVAWLSLGWECEHSRWGKFYISFLMHCMSVNNCESTVSVHFVVTNMFYQVGNLEICKSANNEDQLLISFLNTAWTLSIQPVIKHRHSSAFLKSESLEF